MRMFGDGEEIFESGEYQGLRAELETTTKELSELRAKVNSPEIDNFLEGVRLEAAHQRDRWNTDQAKTDADWFWTVGYLVGKALHKDDKRLHHLITAAACLYNWHHYTKNK